MTQRFFKQGFAAATARPGLVGLLYAFGLVVALIVTVPIFLTLASVTGTSGFSPVLSAQFDVALWADIMEDAGSTFQALQLQLFWIIPFFLLWKTASSVGVISTLYTNGATSFWEGLGEYTGRAVLLALVFLVPIVALSVGIAVVTFALTMIWTGEVGGYWIFVVILPVMIVLGFALLDLMHDYARMELVIGNKPVMESMISGLTWPFRNGGAAVLYAGWFIVALILIAVPTIIDLRPGGLWGVFLLQQIVLFVRAATTVGWFGSEVAYYDAVVTAEMPSIAEEEPTFTKESLA